MIHTGNVIYGIVRGNGPPHPEANRMVPSARRLAAALLLLVPPAWLHGAEAPANCWPQFRGPGASGVSAVTGLPDAWSATERVAWKTRIPGRGWSSPVVWGDRVFVTTAIKEGGELEPVKKGLYLGGNRAAPTEPHRWVVYGLDLGGGKILWEREVHRGVPAHGHHLKNTLASETPVTDSERLYAYFGNVGLFCLSEDGDTFVIRPGPAFELIRTNRLGELCMATPAVVRGGLVIRTESHIVCIR